MVIFAGPHKSASSSVQELFMKFASNDPSRKGEWNHPSLQQWTWPWNPRRHSYQPRKGFAPLVTEGIGYHRLIWDTILQVWNATDSSGHFLSPHIIWGTEELDRFGTTPWSGRNGLQAMYDVFHWTRPSQLEIVVNYRRPRQAQWVSIWKQLMRKIHEGRAYQGFLCDPEEYQRIWEYLDCVANPLGFIEALLDFWDKKLQSETLDTTTRPSVLVHLLDMEGIAGQKRDVGHVLACDVLGVNCTADHWLPDVERPILRNAKTGNPELSDAQMEEMEWILRQRDCSYRQRLVEATTVLAGQGSTRLHLHYADTLWDACSTNYRYDSSMFANTTFLLDLLQSQVGCGHRSQTAIAELQKRQREQTILSTFKDTAQTRVGGSRPSSRAMPPGDDPTDMVRSAKIQLCVLYMLLVLVVGVLVRRLKFRGCVPPRRLVGRHQAAKRSFT